MTEDDSEVVKIVLSIAVDVTCGICGTTAQAIEDCEKVEEFHNSVVDYITVAGTGGVVTENLIVLGSSVVIRDEVNKTSVENRTDIRVRRP